MLKSDVFRGHDANVDPIGDFGQIKTLGCVKKCLAELNPANQDDLKEKTK